MITPISPNTPAPPSPVTKRAHGRSLADFGELKKAEKILLDCCATGEEAKIGDAVPTADADPKTIVRADFLRFFMLGGDEQAPVHEKGVQLMGAWIEGKLDLGRCYVPHCMRLLACRLDQLIDTSYAHFARPLALSGSRLMQGLMADGLRCDSDLLLQYHFWSSGEVRLLGAHIGGNLQFSSGQFLPEKGGALSADGIVVKGSVFLDEGFKATGLVRLLSAKIDRNLSCCSGQFVPEQGAAFIADGIVVKGTVNLNEGFKATGVVRLLGAQIDGNLSCSGGQFVPIVGEALIADRIVVKGTVNLNNGFKANGEVRLLGAQIGGDLSCSGGDFASEKVNALSADGIRVKGAVSLNKGFKANGVVRLLGAQIDGNLDCVDASFISRSQFALSLEYASIKRVFHLRDQVVAARINTHFAQIGTLEDEPNSWGKGSILVGLVYKSLGGAAPTDAATRIDWLKKQIANHLGEDTLKSDFRPQPWKQLQKVLREMGHDAVAREVGVAYEDQLRKADRIGQIADAGKAKNILPVMRRRFLRALHWLFGFLAGYGYHPLRLFMSLVWVWLSCGFIYWWVAYAPHSAIGPTDPLVFQNSAYQACTTENNGNWMLCKQLPAEYTTFSPLAYSLDVLLPLVDLGQEKRWGPLVPTPASHFCIELLSLSPPHWVRLLNWFQILYGWIASLLFVAIVSGMSRRSEMDK